MSSLVKYEHGDPIALANALHQSGLFPDTKTANVALVKVLAGSEYGLGPVAAMTGIHVIDGKPAPSAGTLAGLVKKSGRYDYRVKEWTGQACVLEFSERGESVGESSFTFDDAKRAGLSGKKVWQNYPRNMLFARAVANGVRLYCPDLVGGQVLVAEEAADMASGEPEFVPNYAQEEPGQVEATAVEDKPISRDVLKLLSQAYAASGWREEKPVNADDGWEPAHETLRLQLGYLGVNNEGDIVDCLSALTDSQAERLLEALKSGELVA